MPNRTVRIRLWTDSNKKHTRGQLNRVFRKWKFTGFWKDDVCLLHWTNMAETSRIATHTLRDLHLPIAEPAVAVAGEKVDMEKMLSMPEESRPKAVNAIIREFAKGSDESMTEMRDREGIGDYFWNSERFVSGDCDIYKLAGLEPVAGTATDYYVILPKEGYDGVSATWSTDNARQNEIRIVCHGTDDRNSYILFANGKNDTGLTLWNGLVERRKNTAANLHTQGKDGRIDNFHGLYVPDGRDLKELDYQDVEAVVLLPHEMKAYYAWFGKGSIPNEHGGFIVPKKPE